MSDRTDLIEAFVAQAGWGDAIRKPLAGDASNRRYFRLCFGLSGRTSVLMDAPSEKGEGVRPFVVIARYLRDLGLSAPEILAEDEQAGLLLLEDLGDDLFARVLERDSTQEVPLYEAATDLLVDLHKSSPPKAMPAYDPALMTNLAALAFDWYLKGATGAENTKVQGAFCASFEPLLQRHCSDDDVLIQRDYHAENLLWLPERNGVARVGLLDFQDALRGHRAYDLVSLLQDARRDVSPRIEYTMLGRYIGTTDQNPITFTRAYHLLGAQRNLRIIGVFARLCIRDGKTSYLSLLPRVWDHLKNDLADEALAPIRPFIAMLPDPTPDILDRIKAQCAKHPMP